MLSAKLCLCLEIGILFGAGTGTKTGYFVQKSTEKLKTDGAMKNLLCSDYSWTKPQVGIRGALRGRIASVG
jgi:hypothetical protein